MAQRLAEIMTPSPRTVEAGASLQEAARTMREAGIGDVLVVGADQTLQGIVTDRDIAIRGVADGCDPASTTVGEICTGDITACSPEDDVAKAVQLMRDRAIRRLPVVQDGRPVGIVSIGDLAIERDPDSALADISAAPGSE
jgi:CBS domain-containing protein